MSMFTIIQGEDKSITVRLEDENKDAYGLSGVTALTAVFKKVDGTKLEKTMAGGAISILGGQPQNGKVKIELSDSDTMLLKVGKIDFEILIDEGSIRKIVQFVGQIEVKKRIIT